jgi:hypothetical protein
MNEKYLLLKSVWQCNMMSSWTLTLPGLTSISFWTERGTVLLHVVGQLQQIFANVRANSWIHLDAEGKEFNGIIQLLSNFFWEDLGHDDLLEHYHPSWITLLYTAKISIKQSGFSPESFYQLMNNSTWITNLYYTLWSSKKDVGEVSTRVTEKS